MLPDEGDLDVRLDPNGGIDTSAGVTTVIGGKVVANQKSSADRNSAISIARDKVGFPAESLVSCTLNPLPAGTEVRPAQVDEVRHDLKALTRVLATDGWFLMIDRQPGERFVHPVTYVFVDAITGAVDSLDCDYYPLINSQPLWSSKRELFDYSKFSDDPADPIVAPPPFPEVVQQPDPAIFARTLSRYEPDEILARDNTDAASIFAVLVAGNNEKEMELDVTKFKAFLVSKGVPQANIQTVLSEKLAPAEINAALIKAVKNVNILIDSRFKQNKHSTLRAQVSTSDSKTTMKGARFRPIWIRARARPART